MKYQGETRNIRTPAPSGSLDRWNWITLKEGDVIPKELEGLFNQEAKEQKIKDRVDDFVEDLADDGKKNRSNKKVDKPKDEEEKPKVPKQTKLTKPKKSKKNKK